MWMGEEGCVVTGSAANGWGEDGRPLGEELVAEKVEKEVRGLCEL